MSLADFLVRERGQPERFEFDGTQPVPMTGGTVAHARLVRRIIEAMYLRRSGGWAADGSVALPEIGVAMPLPDLYRV